MNPLTSGPVAAPPLASQLANTLADALVRGETALRSLAGPTPRGPSRPVATLLTIYDLHTAPLETVRAVARWQGHPAVGRHQIPAGGPVVGRAGGAVRRRGHPGGRSGHGRRRGRGPPCDRGEGPVADGVPLAGK